jgi:hypothetical protein
LFLVRARIEILKIRIRWSMTCYLRVRFRETVLYLRGAGPCQFGSVPGGRRAERRRVSILDRTEAEDYPVRALIRIARVSEGREESK